MSFDYDFDGADADALALLTGGVSGVDYVGAAPANPAMLMRNVSVPAPLNAQQIQMMRAGQKALQFGAQIAQDRKLRHAALAGYVPTVQIACSTTTAILA